MSLLRGLAFLLLTTSALFSATIFSEDFEGQDVIGAQNQGVGVLMGTQFEVVSGRVDLIDSASPYTVQCQSIGTGSANCIDTTGGGAPVARGTIQTIDSITLQPGQYRLSFDLYGWAFQGMRQSATVEVSFGSLFNQTFSRDGALNPYPTVSQVFSVTEATSARLIFADTGGNAGFAGAILDNISLQTEVPEPSTTLLLVGGLAAIAVLRRKQSPKSC